MDQFYTLMIALSLGAVTCGAMALLGTFTFVRRGGK